MCNYVSNQGGKNDADEPRIFPVSIIKQKSGRFRVKVGCLSALFDSWGYASKEIERYWDNPEKVRLEYEAKV